MRIFLIYISQLKCLITLFLAKTNVFSFFAKIVCLSVFFLFLTAENTSAQVTIWSEDFESYADDYGDNGGSGSNNNTVNAASDWTTENAASDDYFRVESSGAISGTRSFAGDETDEELTWTSESITLTGYSGVSISVLYNEAGSQNGGDYITIQYNLDGAGWTTLTNGNYSNDIDGPNETATVSGLSGTSLQVRVSMNCDDDDEIWYFDNVLIQGNIICNPCYSVANGNYSTGTTWSATSGGATCTCTPDATSVVIIERGYKVNFTADGAAKSMTLGTGFGTGELEWSGNFALDINDAAGITVANNGIIDNNGNLTANIEFDNNSGITYLLSNEGTFDIGNIIINNAALTMSGSADIHLDADLSVEGNNSIVTNNNTGTIIIDDDVFGGDFTFTMHNYGNIFVDDDLGNMAPGEVFWYNYANSTAEFNEDMDTDLQLYANYDNNTIIYSNPASQTALTPQDSYWHLTLTGNGAKNSQGSFSIKGDFTNNSIWNDGNFVHTFDGTGNQQILGTTTPTTFNDLIVNKGNTLTSAIDLIIKDELQMDAGTFLMDGETITCNNAVDINGGTLRITAGTFTQDENDDADFDQDGGTFDIDGGTVNIGVSASQSDTDYNLDGGTLDVSAGTLNIADAFDMDGGSFIQSGGTINIKSSTVAGGDDAGPKFDVSSGAVTITNGTINLCGAYDNTITYPAADYNPTSSSIIGGTIVAKETGSNDEEFYVDFNGNSVYNFEVNKTAAGAGTVTIWSENFSDGSDGDIVGDDDKTTPVGAVGADWSRSCATCTITEGGQNSNKFRFHDTDENVTWTSETITISGYSNVGITMNVDMNDNDMEGNDCMTIYYNLDGAGPTVFASNGALCGDGSDPTVVSQTGLNGSTLVITVVGVVSAADEDIYFDDIVVTGTSGGGGSYVYLSDNLDVNNDLTFSNEGGIDVTAGNRQINLYGDWINNSTIADPFIEQQGTVIFDGGAAQSLTLGTLATETFYDLTMNNTVDELTINDPIIVTHALTLTDGNIITTGTNLLTLNDGATSTSGSAASFIDGPMKKIGNEAFDFPVGDAGSWRRIGITAPATVTTEFIATYFKSAYANTTTMALPLKKVSVVEYWTLDEAVTGDDVKVTLFWENAATSGISNCAELEVAHWTGATWVRENATAVGTCTLTGTGSITTDAVVTSFSPFTFGSDTSAFSINPLPIELLAFDAVPSINKVNLSWVTASEINNDYFTIERTIDGVNFEVVATAKGAGNSTSILNYTSVDNIPYDGVAYYRLKQTDYDGNFTYSELKMVHFEHYIDFLFNIFPNPNDGSSFNLQINSNNNEEVLVVVYDILGNEIYSKVIITQENSGNIYAIDPSQKLSPGLYTITAASNDKIYNKKLIVN